MSAQVTSKAKMFTEYNYYGYADASDIPLIKSKPYICCINGTDDKVETEVILSGTGVDNGITVQVFITDEDYNQSCYGLFSDDDKFDLGKEATPQLVDAFIEFYNNLIRRLEKNSDNVHDLVRVCRTEGMQQLM